MKDLQDLVWKCRFDVINDSMQKICDFGFGSIAFGFDESDFSNAEIAENILEATIQN